MIQSRFYIGLTIIVSIVLITVLLWGPIGKEDKSKGYLWNQDWTRIEYQHRNFAQQLAGKKPEKEIFFIREPGLKKDTFFVEARHSKNHIDPQKRSGNFNLKNIFSDWRKPEQKGFYNPDSSKRKFGGLDAPTGQIKLYKNSTSPEVEVLVGKKIKNGNFLVEIVERGESPILAVIAGHYVDKLRYDLNHYRNKRVIFIPAKGYIKELEFSWFSPTQLRMHLIKDKQKNPDDSSWKLPTHDNKIIPEKIVLPVLGLVKQIQLGYFSDELDLAKNKANHIWEKNSIKFMDLTIILSDKNKVEVQIRKPVLKTKIDNKEIVLIKTSHSSHVDWVDLKLYNDIYSQLQTLSSYKPVKPKKIKSGAFNIIPGSRNINEVASIF